MTRRIVLAAAKAGTFVTLLFVGVLLIRPVSVDTAVDAYVLALGAIAVLAFVRATRAASAGSGEKSKLEAALARRRASHERPRELARVEREVELALASAFYLHYRLRPLARMIAEHRFGVRRGLPLDGPGARAVLSDDQWELLRPDRREPSDPNAPGISLQHLRSLVSTLERL